MVIKHKTTERLLVTNWTHWVRCVNEQKKILTVCQRTNATTTYTYREGFFLLCFPQLYTFNPLTCNFFLQSKSEPPPFCHLCSFTPSTRPRPPTKTNGNNSLINCNSATVVFCSCSCVWTHKILTREHCVPFIMNYSISGVIHNHDQNQCSTIALHEWSLQAFMGLKTVVLQISTSHHNARNKPQEEEIKRCQCSGGGGGGGDVVSDVMMGKIHWEQFSPDEMAQHNGKGTK